MSERGRGGGQRGMGAGGVARRHRVQRDNLERISKGAIRRLARRAGITRIGSQVDEFTRQLLKDYLEHVVRDTIVFTEYQRHKTISQGDVKEALRRQGRVLYI
jgi:histone H4